MDDLPACRLASWADVDRWANAVADRVRTAHATPDTIVGLTRGGWVPARLLADRLGVRRIVSLRAQHWGVTARPDGRAELTEGLSGPVRGLSVLVVDDITDTGESLWLALEHVRAEAPTRLESATFLHITRSKVAPTYYAEEIPREAWVWVVFPWNYWEDLTTLVARASKAGKGLTGLQRTLRVRCGLSVPREHLARVLPHAKP